MLALYETITSAKNSLLFFSQLSLYYDLLGPLWMKDKDLFLSGNNNKLFGSLCGMERDEVAKITARYDVIRNIE